MNGLMILLTLLVIVLLIGMTAMYVLYYSLFKAFQSLKRSSEIAIPQQNEAIAALNSEIDAFLSILGSVEEQALECYDTAKKFVSDAEENKKVAMRTIKTARQLQRTLESVTYLEKAAEGISTKTRFDADDTNAEETGTEAAGSEDIAE
jgi:hypothetical protein